MKVGAFLAARIRPGPRVLRRRVITSLFIFTLPMANGPLLLATFRRTPLT